MCPPAGKIAWEGHRLARAAGEQVSSHRSMTSQPSVAASSRPRPGALGSLVGQKCGRVNPSFVPGDVYHNVVASLRVCPVAAAYIAAMVVLGLHLYHGTWSALQTLGLNPPPTHRWRRGAAAAIAVLIAGGYISIPMAVLAGVLR